MTVFSLKLVALFSMLADHLSYILFDKVTFMNIIGRLSFPIFAFLITEGYIHTKNLKKYFLRLFIFAILSQAPFMLYLSLFNSSFALNIFFTLFLGLFAITLFDKIKNKPLGLLFVIFIATVSELIHCDYGWFGISIIFLFYALKNKNIYMNIIMIILILFKYILEYIHHPNIIYIFLCFGTLSSLFIINFYNKQKGRNIKYFLYFFYPLHLLILYFLKMFL